MPDEPTPPVPLDETLDGTLGFQVLEVGAERAVGCFEVAHRVRQQLGLVHGGAYAAQAESLASQATFAAVYPDGFLAVGLSNHTSFLRPVTEGMVTAEARRRHRGRTTWVWEVDFTDDQGHLCATSRVTLAVRPLEAA